MVNRVVVGAHYGLKDWLAQRITAVLMLAYVALLIVLLFCANGQGYDGWKALFQQTWVRLFSTVTMLALLYHAWVGVRDIWMDYVKPVSVRLTLHVLTILWLVGCFVYSVKVLWGV
ncbi:succinate dehydrogenase, hydrophobic membrane anchor protein [Chitinivorax sp. B]|uniref:succinate dehydrogenase, hydrophobic membrane anchor protein n=1 Tax=Chitinivorax sp. B TaxID=2502235 RepID=UPI0010F49BDA|nr:succinate dehydrogenase, hydrophobic membrane anchor protein [Chitinivorax sp. B]